MDLATERCEACHKDSPRVPETEEQTLLAGTPGWDLIEVDGVKRLQRTFKVKGWRRAVALTDEIAAMADESGHHPAILTEWGNVTVQWWTHAIGGLHRNDFIMAAKVDAMRGDQ